MATFNKFQCFVQDLGLQKHHLDNDVLKVYLSNELPMATDTVFGNPADIAAGNGYTAGGTTIGTTSWVNTTGTSALSSPNVVFTAAGGSIGPFQYVVLYNDTATADNLIGWYNYGSAVTLATSETFTVDFTTNVTILTIA